MLRKWRGNVPNCITIDIKRSFHRSDCQGDIFMLNIRKSSHFRKGIAAAMLSSALVGGFLATGPLAAVVPAQAEAVRVDAPQQPGFADVVEKVSPAVVSVRVKSAVHQTADDGAGMPGFDQL